MSKKPEVCQWVTLQEALKTFVENKSGHQGSGHIKALHWYVACRLVVEGGFHPDEITPHPPFAVADRGNHAVLGYDAQSGKSGELTILGGLKTKDVDVVVTKKGIGPVLAVSMKGTLNAFRNLTNRMEEAVGDCTNLHISYPALVYGFLQVMRANLESPGVNANDVAIRKNGEVADSILRYHDVLARLAGREDVRSESSKYEAIALAMVNPDPAGTILKTFPKPGSTLLFGDFFARLYTQYDLRFVYAAPRLEGITRRLEWDSTSPALADARKFGYEPRMAGSS